jgi:hypothetical protein
MAVALKDEKGRRMISCREAAQEYGCTMRYLRALAKKGRIHTESVGGAYLFDLQEIRRLATRSVQGREKKRSEGFQPG